MAPPALPPPSVSEPVPGSGRGSRARPPRYRRHPKPPYSYLALIALVIRAAPGHRLKLAQILQRIRALFPFFGGGYQGWKDSVRHNLSSNPCFAKVLKDPSRPKAKGNYWTVDVSRIPPAALRLQNTAVARGGGAPTFARDLTPFILQGHPYPPTPPLDPPKPPPSTFSIASLLREFPEGEGTPQIEGGQHPSASFWEAAPLFPLWVPPPPCGKAVGGSDPKGGPHAMPHLPNWGQLPTSYSTSVAPNAVAPPCGTPFLSLRWGVLPPSPPKPLGVPSDPKSEEGGAQAMPPNKSIFDVWLSHPGDTVNPALHG
ncbi:LOW QUALITY PROTEIN: forkhead box protein H1 [Cuculus canorus]|uniref:LOW QUALITY PROTEIN: forkhead box protein H1 n=1 Tax=Cuculus canorus TaxID=55661 RepID=UPI0023AAE5AB|nr:LOW QUALITY PROTEIN: forkhead box protein H1 [Cuculus canorus]